MKGFIGMCILLLITGMSACKQEDLPGEYTPPIAASAKLRFAQQETEGGYWVEARIPWKTLGLEAAPSEAFGFELFLVDDDDGGLKDAQLSWNSAASSSNVPATAGFGTLNPVKSLSSPPTNQILFTEEAPTIDGEEDEPWKEVVPFPIETLYQGTILDPGDFGGKFRAIWDTSNLYILIEIRDNESVVDSRMLSWEDDGIIIYLDPSNEKPDKLEAGKIFSYGLLHKSPDILINDFPIAPTWTVPHDEVYDGGPGKDGIPALENPEFVAVEDAGFMRENDLILGYVKGNEARAYPHRILDWHEIINDNVVGDLIAVTYCPLTGTGVGWKRDFLGPSTTFGVSGLLYNTNLIPYDRATNSNWSQIRLDCVQGASQGKRIETFQLVETTWKSWKEMYPHTKVVSTETGFTRDYNVFPYGDYKTNHSLLYFPVSPDDTRLPRKTRVHGIVINNEAVVYPLSKFGAVVAVLEDTWQGVPIVIAGSNTRDFVVSFESRLEDGTLLDFAAENNSDPHIILKDNEGNQWDIFGNAVSGPRMGTRLRATESFMGYWMAFGSFYPNATIVQ